MITEFYIVNKSFEYNINISKEILENRIKDLSEDYEYIKRYPTEKIFVHHTIYEQAIFEDITVSEFLEFTPKVKEKFNKQVVSFLNIIIRKSKSTSYTVDEVVDVLLNEQSKENLL